MNEVHVDPNSEPVPVLDTYVSNGPEGRRWQVRCRTCEWEISGEGERPIDSEAAKSHRCPAC